MNTQIAGKAGTPGIARAKWLFFFTFLTLFAIIDCFHDFVARRVESNTVDALSEVLGGLFYWGPCLALVPVVIALVKRFPLIFKRPGSIALHPLAGLLFAYLNVMIQAIPQRPFFTVQLDSDYWGRFFYLLKFQFALYLAFYSIVLVSIYLLRQYEDLKEREIRASQLEVALGEARLRAVQAQLNPHFFFNTLQAISVMAMAGEREGVVEMLSRLSSLLRVSFDKHRPQQVPLADEMAFVVGYLGIQQLCFGERLIVENDVRSEVLNAYVPSMLLQPLVENALVHGIAVKPGRGTIRITGRRSGDDLLIEVADSGPGFQTRQPYRSGVGLAASESRLNLIFASNHSIEYGLSNLGGASVKVRIPFLSGAPQRLHGAPGEVLA